MKTTITTLLMIIAINFGYSQIYYQENFNGNSVPTGWHSFSSAFEIGNQHWEFGSGVTPGSDIADFTTNAAIFNDPSGHNVSYLWHNGVDVSDVANDIDYALILSFKYALNTFGNDSQPDKFKLAVRDGNGSDAAHVIWETNTETDPTWKYIDFKGFQSSFNNVDYSNFYFYFIFDDVNGSNGWGAGVDDVSFYTRPHNDSFYANLHPEYVATSLPYYYEQRADYQVNLINDPQGISNMPMANGLWYKYVADYTGDLTVHGNAYDYDCEISAFEKNGNDFTLVSNIDAGLSGDMESMVIPIINGHTYYFNVGYYSNSDSVTAAQMHGNQFISLAKTPVNDTCANAIDFTANANNVNFSLDTTGATSPGALTVSSCGSTQDGVWYKFTAPTSGMYNTHVTNAGNYDADAMVSVYTGSCGNFSCVTSGILQGLTDNEFSVTTGTEYYINISTNTSDPIIQSGTTDLHFFYTSSAGLEDNLVANLKVYPNPFKDVVNITANEHITRVSLYNKQGQLIVDKKADKQKVILNIERLSSGFYILKIEAGDKISTKKLIKQ